MKTHPTHNCNLHNHYGEYMCRCWTLSMHVYAWVYSSKRPSLCWNEIALVFLRDFIVFMFCIVSTHSLPLPSEQLDKIHLVMCQEGSFFLLYAWVAGFYLSPLTSPVYVQWSPTVSAGNKHREDTGQQLLMSGDRRAATSALVSLTGIVCCYWLLTPLCWWLGSTFLM